ncbi:MAG: hypothetical protein D6775_02155 [Caldilineae bacterium]|nr:MAG: hypothetical protein D6775_02155 [Caldilineae bacterium]
MAEFDIDSPFEEGLTRKPTLVPTLILGLGGTGIGTLRAFKRRMRQALNIPPLEEGPGIIQLLGVDTVPWINPPGEEYLHRHEYAYIGGYNATQVLRHLDNHPTVKAWWKWDARAVPLGQIHSGARQTRCVGRLSLYRRYRTFWNHLQPKINRMASVATIEEAENLGYPVVREGGIRHVYIVSSLCGGTGSGIFLDVAHKLRSIFQEQAVITGIFALPSVFLEELDSDLQKARIQANTYAALKELDYFQAGHDFVTQFPGEPEMVVSRPFDRIYLIERRNRRGEVLSSIGDVMEMIGHQIFLESISHIGSHIWAYDVNITQERNESGQGVLAYSSFATSSLVVPKERMQEYCALKYGERLLENNLLHWLTPADINQIEQDAAALVDEIDDVLHRRFPQGQSEERDTRDLPGVEWEEEEEWDAEAGEESVAEEIPEEGRRRPADPWTAEAFHSLLDELREQIHEVTRRTGLRGGHYFVSTLHRLAVSRQQDNRAAEADLSQRITATETRLRQLRDPMIVNLLSFWPFDMLFTNNIRRAKQQERMVLADHLVALNHEYRTAQNARSIWSRLVPILDELADAYQSRISEVESARDKGFEEALNLFFRLRRRKEKETIFNLTSDAVDENYIVEQFEVDNWRHILSQRVDDSLDELIGSPFLFRIEITFADRRALLETSFSETLSLVSDVGPWVSDGESQQLSWAEIYEHLLNHCRTVVNRAIPPEEYHLGAVLASNQAMLSERFKQLFSRCYPFWRYDLDKGGFDEQDLEHTILVGLDDDTRYVRLYDQLLLDYTEFERVSTGDPTRIDACRIEHGLPIGYLESMANYYRHYREFLSRGPLHLDADWVRLPEIILRVDKAAVGLPDLDAQQPLPLFSQSGDGTRPEGESPPTVLSPRDRQSTRGSSET